MIGGDMASFTGAWRAGLAAGLMFWAVGCVPALADLRIGVAAEPYPPFAVKDATGAWAGWEIDFMNALCDQLSEKCSVVEVAWDGIIPALNAKKFDVILASMAITEKRKQEILFSNFYYDSSISMIAAKDSTREISPAGLTGATIGVQISTISAAYAEKHFSSGSTVKTYPTLDEALADLNAGRIDAVQGETNALAAFLKADTGAACCASLGRVPPDPSTLGEGVGAGLRKDDVSLKERIDAAISKLAQSGKMKDITKSYPDLVTGIVLPN
jgi:polar amino acid transport system substrate-binding protein